MKKLFIAVAIVCAAGIFTSCKKEKCWEVTYTISGVSATSLIYGTEEDVQAAIDAEKSAGGTWTKKSVSKSKSDCVSDVSVKF